MIVSRKVHVRLRGRGKRHGNRLVDATWKDLDGNTVEGIFRSVAEADRWKVLLNWEDEGRISNLQLGKRIWLVPEFTDMHGNKWSWHYTPDYTYVQNGIHVVEDYKSENQPIEWRHKEVMFRHLFPDVHFFVNSDIHGEYVPPKENHND